MMKRLKELEEENRRLKKMYTEERLKAESSRRLLMKRGAIPQRSEEKQSGEAIFEKGISIRLACKAFRISESC